jgi:hypothetical protein
MVCLFLLSPMVCWTLALFQEKSVRIRCTRCYCPTGKGKVPKSGCPHLVRPKFRGSRRPPAGGAPSSMFLSSSSEVGTHAAKSAHRVSSGRGTQRSQKSRRHRPEGSTELKPTCCSRDVRGCHWDHWDHSLGHLCMCPLAHLLTPADASIQGATVILP